MQLAVVLIMIFCTHATTLMILVSSVRQSGLAIRWASGWSRDNSSSLPITVSHRQMGVNGHRGCALGACVAMPKDPHPNSQGTGLAAQI